MTRPEIVAYSKGHGVVLEVFNPSLIDDLSLNVFEAWGALLTGYRFDYPALISLAKKYGKDASKIQLRYSFSTKKSEMKYSTDKSSRILNASLRVISHF